MDDIDCMHLASAWNKTELGLSEMLSMTFIAYSRSRASPFPFNIKADDEALLPVSWDLTISDDCNGKVTDHGSACIFVYKIDFREWGKNILVFEK